MATKPWDQMSVNEKLDELHVQLERLISVTNQSADRGNQAFANLDYRLSQMEKHVTGLTVAVEALQEKFR
jgi:hypothetical protein